MGWIFSIMFIIISAFSPAGKSSDIYAGACIIAAGLFAISGSIAVKDINNIVITNKEDK